MPLVENVEQGSAEWLTMRAGMATASRVADITATLKKGGYAASRQSYLMEVVCSRLTGIHADHYVSPAMLWGMDTEPLARAAYEIMLDKSVDVVGMAIHSRIKWFSASPDGLIGDDGILEIKCPTTATHIGYLLENKVPEEYVPQMLAEMACTDRQWCDFVSFDPRLPKRLQMFAIRFMRDDERVAEMEKEVEKFLAEVDLTIERLEHAISL